MSAIEMEEKFNISSGGPVDAGRALFDSCQGGYGDMCCPLVVDTLSWIALLAGIALATFFLRQPHTDDIKNAVYFSLGRQS